MDKAVAVIARELWEGTKIWAFVPIWCAKTVWHLYDRAVGLFIEKVIECR